MAQMRLVGGGNARCPTERMAVCFATGGGPLRQSGPGLLKAGAFALNKPYLNVFAAASSLVIRPPGIPGGWRSVHRTFHHAKVGGLVLAGTIALPPVGSVELHLIVERVIHGDGRTGCIVDTGHVLKEVRPVRLTAPLTLVTRRR